MNTLTKNALSIAAALVAVQASAQVTFYERENFSGRSFGTDRTVSELQRRGFDDRASSAIVQDGYWEVCENPGFGGRCAMLRPGRYPTLAAMALNDRISSVRNLRDDTSAGRHGDEFAADRPQITFYQREGFGGRAYRVERRVDDLRRTGFDDEASSALVSGGRWEVCDGAGFAGRCVVLSPGNYPSLTGLGLHNRVSSARSLGPAAGYSGDEGGRREPRPLAGPDYRRRYGESLYEAPVSSVHAVVGAPEQRCWIEKEQLPQARGEANVPAAIAGAVIGGVLGHQVGDGRGKDLATAGGAVAGAVVGANIGRGEAYAQTQDVQRCVSVPSRSSPDYWDVTYNFRGLEHRVQLASPPGPTVTVNAQGEPRE